MLYFLGAFYFLVVKTYNCKHLREVNWTFNHYYIYVASDSLASLGSHSD